ncbi:MAG: NBR1-Ig-like domain-containing protein [Chloroflexota bacterium]|nr:NBR1-Ig-like domain-containing protein [Chloroflexota bacterium]
MIKRIALFSLLLISLVGCIRQPAPAAVPTLDEIRQTNEQQVTLEAATATKPIPTQTLQPLSTWTPVPTIERTRPLIQSPTPDVPCDQAAAGVPLDVTIPDGTVMTPGEHFTKTWRLENVGSCTWTRLYALTFFSGNSLNALQTNFLIQEIESGDVVDLTVSMQAPQNLGVYQSNWMLSNAKGELFGIGRNGDAPFWVKIEVVPVGTATQTPTPTPTLTQTPEGFLTGDVNLANGDQFDLDNGILNPEVASQADFNYQYDGTPPHILSVMNGTQWMVYGENQPAIGDCTAATLLDNAISFTEVPVGTYVCYRTSEALLGRLMIEGFEEGQLSISFLTWLAP